MSLQRQLLSGDEFSSLFPDSSCDKVRMGKGDTQTSIELMVKQIKTHYKQVVDVAAELIGNDLAETCENIHWFLYNHFQYLADGEDQLLRSPACAWKMRKEGIDCKSYSIIASCLLINLGIKHYIRKIKQPTFSPDNYTHVYVIVPIDQKNGSLNKGYYTIDGTLPTTQEPTFTSFKDYFMEGLQHYALNGKVDVNNIKLDDLTAFRNVKDFLKTPVSCWGGTAFDAAKADETYQIIGNFFTDLLSQFNEAVKVMDLDKLGILYTNYFGWLIVSRLGYERKKTEGYNKCSKESMDRMLKVIDFFENKVGPLLVGWLKQYFTIDIKPQTIYFNNQQAEVYHNFYFAYTDPEQYWEGNVRNFTPKQGLEQIDIKAFQFTPYIEQLAQSNSSGNLQEYLNTLTTVLLPKLNSQAYEEGNADPSNTNNNNPSKDNKDNTLTYLGIAGLLFFGYKYISR